MTRLLGSAALTVLLALGAANPAAALTRGKPVHAVAMYGEPKYGPSQPFDFLNLNAPKTGTLVMANSVAQTFDSFNPFILKGSPQPQAAVLMHDTLMAEGRDEPFTMYCLLCETVEIAPDNTWVEFKLRTNAHFSDGSPITAEDIVWGFNTLMEKGSPTYKLYYGDVTKAEAKGKNAVRFTFKAGDNRELPLILGQVPVISKAYWSKRDFAATTLDKPVVSGPYLIDTFEVGRNIVLKRDPKYWGKDLVVNRGMYNFETVRVEYFRDDTVSFEAFKTGAYDFTWVASARKWVNEFNFPAVKDGRVQKYLVTDGQPMTPQAFIFNLRKPMFQDKRVREALNLAYDFESLNKTLFLGQYQRLRSYFQKSDLEAIGLPSADERALLDPLRDKLPPEVFTKEFTQPTTEGQGNVRDNLLKARDLLAAAGWVVKDGQLVNGKTGQPFVFEMIETQQGLDTMIMPWLQNLERLGIKGTLRQIDSTQYMNRANEFDYDVISISYPLGLNPGNEQRDYWGTGAADRKGSRNFSGIKDPAVDVLIEKIIAAPDRPALIAATRALDRVLTWNHYRALLYSGPSDRFAHWKKLHHPERVPMRGYGQWEGVMTMWWADPATDQPKQ